MSDKKRPRAQTNPLERANKKRDEEFIADYLKSSVEKRSPWVTAWTHPRTGSPYSLVLQRPAKLDEKDLVACFDLIAETSRADYETSSVGWHPGNKLKEMRSEDLRYVLVKDEAGAVRGFTSLMPTYEAGQPVVYCYEIHLKPELQRTGMGALLMSLHTTVAENLPPCSKVMLTVFLANQRALDFYRRVGFEKDEISPEPRKLRFGKTFVPDYAIMSKTIARGDDASAAAVQT